MKKLLMILTVAMLMFSSLAYAGGDQNCGIKGQGSTGDDAQGQGTQTRTPAD